MTLGLHPECIARLRASLAEQLSRMTVSHGMLLTPKTSLYLLLAQEVLPKTGKTHATLQRIVSETPLTDFVIGLLGRELYEGQEPQVDEGPVPLNALPVYTNLDDVASRLTDAFESLPWRYTLSTPLPEPFSKVFCPHIGNYRLSDTIAIVSSDDLLSQNYPLISGIKKRDQMLSGAGFFSLPTGNAPTWEPNIAYLQITLEGFIGNLFNTNPALEAVNSLRAFCGLALALQLLKLSQSYHLVSLKRKLLVHREVNGKWVVENVHELETRHSEAIRDLVLHDQDGSLSDDQNRVRWMQHSLDYISTVFRAGDRAKNVLLGAQWLFESYCGNDELLRFVQAAVVVEILLGDKASSDQTGLGELLANRCAYLIAGSHSQRNEILRDFRDIYEVRSKIVHSGKNRLALGERTLFDKLLWMCRRIIQEEAELLKNDNSKDT